MNNNQCIINWGYSYCLCTSGKSQITPAVLRMNIHRNPAPLRVSLGSPHWLGNILSCSQTSHNRSHGAPIPVIRDASYSDGPSAMTLVSVRNTRVFRTALTALTEHRTLWRRTIRYTSPRRRVALHTYLLDWVETYMHHQNDTCVTLFAVAAVMLKPFTQRLAMCMSFSCRRFFGNAAGAPGNHSYNLSFNDFQNLCIQFVFSSMYLCIYIATYLHLRYPWISVHPPCLINDVLGGCDRASWDMHLEAEIEWTQRCTWRPGLTELRDALGGRDHVNLEALIESVWRYTWWLWLSEFGDALGGRNRASLEIHLEAVIERVWRCTWRPWSSEIGRVLGGGRWTARPVPRLYSSVS